MCMEDSCTCTTNFQTIDPGGITDSQSYSYSHLAKRYSHSILVLLDPNGIFARVFAHFWLGHNHLNKFCKLTR